MKCGASLGTFSHLVPCEGVARPRCGDGLRLLALSSGVAAVNVALDRCSRGYKLVRQVGHVDQRQRGRVRRVTLREYVPAEADADVAGRQD